MNEKITLGELVTALEQHFVVEGAAHISRVMDDSRELMLLVASTTEGLTNLTLRRKQES